MTNPFTDRYPYQSPAEVPVRAELARSRKPLPLWYGTVPLALAPPTFLIGFWGASAWTLFFLGIILVIISMVMAGGGLLYLVVAVLFRTFRP